MVVGLAGACAAVATLGAGYYYLVVVLERLPLLFFIQPVTDPNMLLSIFGGLLGLGLLMGGVGSLISVRKFLQV
jgi:cell division transport system permease protein